MLIQRFANDEDIEFHFIALLDELIAVYRQLLTSIRWLMWALNEPIMRRDNKEGNCTGHC